MIIDIDERIFTNNIIDFIVKYFIKTFNNKIEHIYIYFNSM